MTPPRPGPTSPDLKIVYFTHDFPANRSKPLKPRRGPSEDPERTRGYPAQVPIRVHLVGACLWYTVHGTDTLAGTWLARVSSRVRTPSSTPPDVTCIGSFRDSVGLRPAESGVLDHPRPQKYPFLGFWTPLEVVQGPIQWGPKRVPNGSKRVQIGSKKGSKRVIFLTHFFGSKKNGPKPAGFRLKPVF